MGMEIEMRLRIALHHLAEILDDLQGIHHTQGIRQHETLDIRCHQLVHQLIDVFGRILHTVRPVFQIQIHADALAGSIF